MDQNKMNRMLTTAMLVMVVLLFIASFIVIQRGNTIEKQKAKIESLNTDVARYKADAEESHKIIETYSEAEAKAKEFEMELINDENTENLDVIPSDYILKQLRAD